MTKKDTEESKEREPILAISKSSTIKISVELLVSLIILASTICITYLDLKGNLKENASKFNNVEQKVNSLSARVDLISEVITSMKDAAIYNEILSAYKTQDRWSGNMMQEYNLKMYEFLQKHHTSTTFVLSDFPDVRKIQANNPVGKLTTDSPMTPKISDRLNVIPTFQGVPNDKSKE